MDQDVVDNAKAAIEAIEAVKANQPPKATADQVRARLRLVNRTLLDNSSWWALMIPHRLYRFGHPKSCQRFKNTNGDMCLATLGSKGVLHTIIPKFK